eukprot:GHVU01131802.1.p1 GENE.GHVU01131802.1~~GHVU01131802.1.p1  ORF type:complete len:242 (-),score=31.84 GHVU01131802.1:57-782(-)
MDKSKLQEGCKYLWMNPNDNKWTKLRLLDAVVPGSIEVLNHGFHVSDSAKGNRRKRDSEMDSFLTVTPRAGILILEVSLVLEASMGTCSRNVIWDPDVFDAADPNANHVPTAKHLAKAFELADAVKKNKELYYLLAFGPSWNKPVLRRVDMLKQNTPFSWEDLRNHIVKDERIRLPENITLIAKDQSHEWSDIRNKTNTPQRVIDIIAITEDVSEFVEGYMGRAKPLKLLPASTLRSGSQS